MTQHGHDKTRHHAHDEGHAAPVHVVTVSDTRTATDDRSGALLREKLSEAGFTVVGPTIVKDVRDEIRAAVLAAVHDGARAVILSGGTGVSPRDVTPEVVGELLDKRLDGFGEVFRALSYAEIGAGAVLSRALAGTHGAVFIACVPGSTAAVRLAADKLLVPQLRHILGLLQPPI